MQYRLLGVGTDIEVFLKDKKGNPYPVCGLLGGTKEKPRETPLGPGFTVQEDNVMAEFNVPPAHDSDAFVYQLNLMKGHLTQYFKQHKLDLAICPSMLFDPSQLMSPQARKFGCEPDYDVWTLNENEIDTENPALRRLRTAGGHIHVSFEVDSRAPELSETFLVVKMMDLFLGVPSIYADTDSRRRQFYGRPGAFRVKQYSKDCHGIEYRTLSNFWFGYEDWMYYVFEAVRQAFSNINHMHSAESKLDSKQELIHLAINEGNREAAGHLLSHFGIRRMQSLEELMAMEALTKAKTRKPKPRIPDWLTLGAVSFDSPPAIIDDDDEDDVADHG